MPAIITISRSRAEPGHQPDFVGRGLRILRYTLYAPLFALLLFFPLCACAPTQLDIIQVGPWFAPRPAHEVAVFSSREETRVPWGAIGIIHGPRLPAGSQKIAGQKIKARAAAARMGADGLILVVKPASEDNSLDVRQEPEVFLSGFAIKYATTAAISAAR